MSLEAVTWARKQALSDTGTKLVLVELAYLADKKHRCFPGRAHLAEVSGQDVEKVTADLRALRAGKLLADTGERAGPNRRAVVWVLGVDGPVDDAGADGWDLPV